MENIVWNSICQKAKNLAQDEPSLRKTVESRVLQHNGILDCVATILADKLSDSYLSSQEIFGFISEAFTSSDDFLQLINADILAVEERDPACRSCLQVVLFSKGFQALEASRVGHWLFQADRYELAVCIQMRITEVFGVDIHPAAKIGKGIMIDHATGVVIGETAAVGDNVSLLHGVTLGGTGKVDGDRHPKIGNNVLIGAGALILGNITIGDCSKVGAGSVVLNDVQGYKIVAGVPAKIIAEVPRGNRPGCSMEHTL